MNRIFAFLLAFFSSFAFGQSLTMDPCIWSGDYARCLPDFGIFLNSQRSVFYGSDASDSNYVEIRAAAALATHYTLEWPTSSPGGAGRALETDGSGITFTWYTPFTSAAFDAYKTAIPMKNSAQVASTANISLAGSPGTVDGVDMSFGGTLLLKNQTDPTENGLWTWNGFSWARDSTMPDNTGSAFSAIVPINPGGTLNGNTIWYSRAPGDGTVPFVEIPTTATNAPLATSRAVVTDANGFLAAATTTATEIGYVNGVSSAIQTQLNAKITNPMTTQGDMIYENVTPAPAALARGTSVQLLHSGTTPSWSAVSLTADVTGTLPAGNGGTGITSLGTGIATWLGTPSSANLASALTDETGSGAAVFGTSPTIAAPTISGTAVISGLLDATTGTGIKLPTAGGTPTTLDFYQEDDAETSTFTWNGTGSPGTSGTVTFHLTRIGRVVQFSVSTTNFHATTGTSSAVLTANTAIPANFRPAITQFSFCSVYDNTSINLTTPGICSMTTGGIFSLARDNNVTAFTPAADAGLDRGAVNMTWYH